jgi:hypothetical protein
MTFGKYPKKMIYEIRKYTDINSFMIYSEALSLNVYFNLILVVENKSNLYDYKFPTEK